MVKLDIISGFLGSGKTTLIQHILNSFTNERIAIIENEYGEMQIDKEVLRVAGFDIYELSNGCVCCTLKDDFRLTLKTILEQNVDRIIFEPSGIFILSEIFDLLKDREISSKCTLNSVITVVDGVNFTKYTNSVTGFFADQIKSATTLVISKTQLVQKEQVQAIIQELQTMNESAVIISEDWHKLTTNHFRNLIGVKGLKGSEMKDDHGQEFHEHDHDHDHGYNHNHEYHHNHEHEHSSGHEFASVGFETKKVFELEEIEQRLAEVKEGVYGQIIRSKGLVCGGEGCWEFSYVYGDYVIRPYAGATSGAVTFIGNDLKSKELKKVFG